MPNTVTTITVYDVHVSLNDEEDYIDVDVDLCEDDIMDAADNLGMIVFRNEEDFKEHAKECLDIYEILEEKLEQSMNSPYEKGRILDILKKAGLI